MLEPVAAVVLIGFSALFLKKSLASSMVSKATPSDLWKVMGDRVRELAWRESFSKTGISSWRRVGPERSVVPATVRSSLPSPARMSS